MATSSGSSYARARAFRLLLQGVIAIGLVVGILATLASKAVTCGVPVGAPITGWKSQVLLAASIGGFVTGHLLGRWLENARVFRPRSDGPPEEPSGTRDSLFMRALTRPLSTRQSVTPAKIIVQGGLSLLLLVGAILVAYETLAVFDSSINWPITWFVRCYASSDSAVAGVIGAFAVCFLLGHWLWYPEARGTKP